MLWGHIALSLHGTVREGRSSHYTACAQPSASLLCTVFLYDTGGLHGRGLCALGLLSLCTAPSSIRSSASLWSLAPSRAFPYTANRSALLLTLGFGVLIGQGDGEWVWLVSLSVAGFLLASVEMKDIVSLAFESAGL